jgi:hypothetical protein
MTYAAKRMVAFPVAIGNVTRTACFCFVFENKICPNKLNFNPKIGSFGVPQIEPGYTTHKQEINILYAPHPLYLQFPINGNEVGGKKIKRDGYDFDK